MIIKTVGELIESLKEFGESKKVFAKSLDIIFWIEKIREKDSKVIIANGANDCLTVGYLIEALEKFNDSREVHFLFNQSTRSSFIKELYEDLDGDVIIYCISEPSVGEE